jgi:hypothetical protein
MMAADVGATLALREEAHLVALRLNGGNPGTLAEEDTAGCVLARHAGVRIKFREKAMAAFYRNGID